MDDSSGKAFYDGIAAEYDDMTGFQSRLAGAGRFVRELQTRFAPRSAVDVATGTGVYAIALAQQGLAATGVDLSAEMLAAARRHAAAVGAQVEWLVAAMEDLDARVQSHGDLVLCMGNSLPHLLTDAALAQALCGFRKLLAPGGHVVLQLLNYQRVLERQERIVEVNRAGDTEYVRFYDFLPERGLVRFNILSISWRGAVGAPRLQSVLLKPWLPEELATALAAAGFAEIAMYGGLGFAAFAPAVAETVMLVARGT